MKKNYFLILVAIMLGFGTYSQTTYVNTSTTLAGGNGSGGVTFNVSTNKDIYIKDIKGAFYGTSSTTAELWYNTTAVSGPPTITTAAGWVSLGTVTLTPSNSSHIGPHTIQSVIPTNLLMTAGSSYGFYISGTNCAYTTWSTSLANTFFDPTLTITVGTNVGYGGNAPNPGNYIRAFNGSVGYQLASSAPNDAGTSSVFSNLTCAGTDTVFAKIHNYGKAQMNSVIINWKKNGTLQTPISYISLIDTFGGVNPSSVDISLGTHTFTAGTNTVFDVWTTMPNGVIDTVTNNDSASAIITPAMSGTYTIDGASPTAGINYMTFADAESALNTLGVCGPVIFNVAGGTYNEQVTLGTYTGVSATNTITFKGSSTPAIITYAATSFSDNFGCVKFDGAKHIVFDNITMSQIGTSTSYGYVIFFDNANDSITVKNCTLNGINNTTTSSSSSVIYNEYGSTSKSNFITIDSNDLNNGSYAIYFSGGGTSIATMEDGNVISNNTIKDFYYMGVYNQYQKNSTLSNNLIKQSSTGYDYPYGIRHYYGFYNTIDGNEIHTDGGRTNYGLYIFRCYGTVSSPVTISNNMIVTSAKSTTNQHYGIYDYYTKYSRYYHNSVNVRSGSTTSGGAFYSQASSSTAYGSNELKNNIFTNSGGGYAVYHSGNYASYFTSVDYNLYNSSGTGSIFRYGSTYTTFAAYQTALSPKDANGKYGAPGFISPTNLHLQGTLASNVGTNLASVTMDIDGDTRPLTPSTTVDIGADEYNVPTCPSPSAFGFISATGTTADISWTAGTSDTGWIVEWGLPGFVPGTGTVQQSSNDTVTVTGLSPKTNYEAYVRGICAAGDTSIYLGPLPFRTGCLSMLSGIYTLDPASPLTSSNYVTMGAFMADLADCGIMAAVTLNVNPASGPHMMGQDLGAISGSSATNTVTLNGNGTTVNRGAGTYFLALNGVTYFTIDNFKFINETPATQVMGIHLRNQCDNISIVNNTIDVGTSTSSLAVPIVASSSLTSVFSAGQNANNCIVTGNILNGGYSGMMWYGEFSNYTTGNAIGNNTIKNFNTYGIRMSYCENSTIENNDIARIRASTSTFYGTYLYYYKGMKIKKNKFHNAGGAYSMYGIYAYRSYNSSTQRSEISNNVVFDLHATGRNYGIYFSSTTSYTDIYFNSFDVNTTGTNNYCYGLYSGYASYMNIKNNIFSVTGTGTGFRQYGMYFSSSVSSNVSDNNIYNVNTSSANDYLGRWGSDQATLAGLRTATGGDLNSDSLDPFFASATNLTPLSLAMDNKGTTITGIANDIIGATRSLTTPDIGAYEFTGIPGDMSLVDVKLVRVSDCYGSTDTAWATVKNDFGSIINFATHNLTVNWSVTGPVNSTANTVINIGTLAVGSTVNAFSSSIDMSVPGTYVLTSWIDTNAANAGPLNDTLNNHYTEIVDPIIAVSPRYDTIWNTSDTLDIKSKSPLYPPTSFFFTEINMTNWVGYAGAPSPMPSWLNTLTYAYVEITGLPNSDLGGYTLEKWNGSTLRSSHTFPIGTILSPNGTAIVATRGSGALASSPANFFYDGKGANYYLSPNSAHGKILRDPSGNVVDAVGHYNYTFPISSGATASDWSGTTPRGYNWGNRLTGADVNSATGWVMVSNTNRQDPNTVNSGVIVPAPPAVAGLNWTHNTISIGTAPVQTVGPYTTNGTYEYILAFTNLCGVYYDTSWITVLIQTQDTSVHMVCDSFVTPMGGVSHFTSGFYYDTVVATGPIVYDSIFKVYDVTVNYANTATQIIAICDSFTVPSGATYYTTGTYMDTIPNAAGCDSVITVNLTITNSSFDTTIMVACDSFPWRGTMYTASIQKQDTVLTGSCDSIFVLDLIINYASASTHTMTLCDSFVSASGKVWTISGNYIDTIVNATGCDSILSYNLTIGHTTWITTNPVVCDSMVSPTGKIWNTTGMYHDTLTNTSGCDSAMTFNLTVNYTKYTTQTQSVCYSYILPGGSTATSSGVYTDILTTASGCDSIVTTNLTIKQRTYSSISSTVCGTYTSPSGKIWTATGVYLDTIPNSIGCDSVITVNLTVKLITYANRTVAACFSYTQPETSKTYGITGVYLDTVINSYGCNFIITTNLTINTVTASSITVIGATLTCNSTGVTYKWVDCDNSYSFMLGETGQSFTPIRNGTYACWITSSAGCSDTTNCESINNVGLEEYVITKDNINIYPNPARDYVTIDILSQNSKEDVTLVMHNAIGKVIFNQTVTSKNNKIKINVADVAEGVYTVTVFNEFFKTSKRVVVVK